MRFSKKHLVLLSVLSSVPQVAHAGEVVEFALTKSELSTSENREALLDRMTKFAIKRCKDGSVFAGKPAIRKCAKDLTSQFVKEIDHEALTLLVEMRARDRFRSARR